MPCTIRSHVQIKEILNLQFFSSHLTDTTQISYQLNFSRYEHVYHNIQPHVTRTLLHAILDPTKALPQHYGAIQGLAAFGPSVVSFVLLLLASKEECYNWKSGCFLFFKNISFCITDIKDNF